MTTFEERISICECKKLIYLTRKYPLITICDLQDVNMKFSNFTIAIYKGNNTYIFYTGRVGFHVQALHHLNLDGFEEHKKNTWEEMKKYLADSGINFQNKVYTFKYEIEPFFKPLNLDLKLFGRINKKLCQQCATITSKKCQQTKYHHYMKCSKCLMINFLRHISFDAPLGTDDDVDSDVELTKPASRPNKNISPYNYSRNRSNNRFSDSNYKFSKDRSNDYNKFNRNRDRSRDKFEETTRFDKYYNESMHESINDLEKSLQNSLDSSLNRTKESFSRSIKNIDRELAEKQPERKNNSMDIDQDELDYEDFQLD
jgi:hypothetical protein